MAFSGEHNAFAGLREKLRDCPCDTGACLVHERFDLYPLSERGLFRGSHLCRSQDRQVPISPPGLFSPNVPLSRLGLVGLFFFSRVFFAYALALRVLMT